MKLYSFPLLFAAILVTPEPRYFRYERPILGTSPAPSQTCLPLDTDTFAHATEHLGDLRLYRDMVETPYVIHVAAPVQVAATSIPLLNLGLRGKQTTFDAAMPKGSYSDLDLNVAAHDFIVSVTVSGSQSPVSSPKTSLGSYTIFDLTRQKLGRSTVLHLPKSNFRYLHFQINGALTPEQISGLTVDRVPATKPSYQQVARSADASLKQLTSVFTLILAAHVPVDQLVFRPGPVPAMFSRDVRISAEPILSRPTIDDVESPLPPVVITGNLLRLHTTEGDRRIDEEHLAVALPLVDFNAPSKWTVSIDNGDDAPLAASSIQLEMLEHDLCFEAAGPASYTLFYGDPSLSAPVYDYAALFNLRANATRASEGQEHRDPIYSPRPDQRAFTEKHPALLWISLLAVVGLLGGIALRSSARYPSSHT